MLRQDQTMERVPRTGGPETNAGVGAGTLQFGSKIFMAGQQDIEYKMCGRKKSGAARRA